jgi:hypothetical protein
MRLFEFADAKASLELWKLVNDCVWKAISVQAKEQERLEQEQEQEKEQELKKKKKRKLAPKANRPPMPTIASPQPSKAKKTSAQEIQRQKVQSNIVKSKPKTTSVPSSSATASVGKNQSKRVLHNPNSVSNIQRQLDPLAFDPTIKKLTS